MFKALSDLDADATFDVVVAGAGAAGLAAATFAAIEGLRVLVVERTSWIGGTSALSASTLWVPGTPQGRAINPEDTAEASLRFLDATVGNHAPRAMREAFTQSAAEAIATLESNSQVKFRAFAKHPDYEQQHPGASICGRAIEPLPLDGRALGDMLNRIRPPIPEFTILGGMMVDRGDIGHLLNFTRSWASAKHAAIILAHYGRDRLMRGRRGSRLLMGNALIGRFALSLSTLGATILLDTDVADITVDAAGVHEVRLTGAGAQRTIKINKALVLAGGGFNRSERRRAEFLPAMETWSPAAPGHTGELQRLALKLGARYGEGEADSAFWAPVSIRRRADGSMAVFPHFVLDRAKPGTVCVDQGGQRFVNESASYHVFARAMIAAHATRPTVPCYIITDARGLKQYGLGMVRMGTRDLNPYLQDGYLIEAPTIEQLADALRMPGAALAATVAEMNEAAQSGRDPRFGRGETAYHRHNGDHTHAGPNPTLGPIRTPPFYAVRLYPGDIGAAKGLAIDPWARVLATNNAPIGRLYAVGNEAQSIMGGVYPGPGITLGPAITFAYRAIRTVVHPQG